MNKATDNPSCGPGKPLRRARLSVALLMLLGILCWLPGVCIADSGDSSQSRHSLWVVESATNRTYLMGSVHVLRERDYPLPEVFYSAYDDAEELVMEVDLTTIDPIATLAMSREIAMLAEGATLASVIGKEAFDRASELAAKNNINLDLYKYVEPWYAAMTISQIQLQRLGFKVDKGIEFHFMTRARQDNKPTSGLETIANQFQILDQLPRESQIGFFLESLNDREKLLDEGEKMLTAWKTGDAEQLEALFSDDLNNNPHLRRTLLLERNMKWLPKIIALTGQKDDYLVIVGALHLVGKDGIIHMLRERGLVVRQL
ncbi:MAG: TraB/GumN family protein [Gammaproteobacteria bacterium]|nr:TraB/GumN family protein [Gammaproteobacteria bacterium]